MIDASTRSQGMIPFDSLGDASGRDDAINRALQNRREAEARLTMLRAELSLEELRLAIITAWILAQRPS